VKALRRFGAFWWDFVIGDDWRLAFAGGLALALTALLAHNDKAAWWVTPVVVVGVLVGTVARARPASRKQ
jgi:hypothetical protein